MTSRWSAISGWSPGSKGKNPYLHKLTLEYVGGSLYNNGYNTTGKAAEMLYCLSNPKFKRFIITNKEAAYMNNMVKGLLLVLVALIMFAMPAHAGDVSLSGAASLKDVVGELEAMFAKNNAGVTFQNNFGASGAVAKQIENGAPADLFFSANVQWMNYLKDKKFLDDRTIRTLAFNTLVFVGKPDLKVKTMQDVVSLSRIAIGSPKSVPAGEYAVQAFKKAGIDKQLENKLVMAKDVRACLMYADTGEVSGAFVYKTDADLMAKNVKILFVVPQNLYPRVTYPVALTAAGTKKAEAVAFYTFLKSPEAEKVLLKYGFAVK